jgi:UDP-N-acetylglucosamine pyrophosphorylase
MTWQNKIFHKSYDITNVNLNLYIYLKCNSFISKDMMHKLGVISAETKVKHINKGGKFLLTPEKNGWIIEK